MPTPIYHFELDIQGEKVHSYYTALSALCISEKIHLTISKATLDRWDWAEPYKKDNFIIRRGHALNTKEARQSDWIDDLPDDVGAEHFGYE